MKSTLMMLSGAAIAMAGPVQHRDVDIVYETAVVVETVIDYYTVTQAVTSTPEATPTENPVVVVTVTADASSSTDEATTTPIANIAVANPTTSSTYSATSTAAGSSFSDVSVYHHNIHRTNHSVAEIAYDDTYAGYAATVAASCTFAHDLTPGGGGYGQNIAMYASSDENALDENTAIAQAITDMWYNSELELYPNAYGSNPDMSDFEAWGHFSQIVWKEQSSLGCAVQKCAPGTMESGMTAWFSVCNYYPAGKSPFCSTLLSLTFH